MLKECLTLLVNIPSLFVVELDKGVLWRFNTDPEGSEYCLFTFRSLPVAEDAHSGLVFSDVLVPLPGVDASAEVDAEESRTVALILLNF